MNLKYVLPDLPYEYSALEPFIMGKMLELHHVKHHGGYVEKANKGLLSLREAQDRKMFENIAQIELSLSFNISGHILHSLFWRNLSPEGGGEPEGDLLAALKESFRTFSTFKAQMNETAEGVQGSGWAALCWEPLGSRLLVLQIHNHSRNLIPQASILMVMDVWEHAYYLQYNAKREAWCEALWNLWNWLDVAKRLDIARKPYHAFRED